MVIQIQGLGSRLESSAFIWRTNNYCSLLPDIYDDTHGNMWYICLLVSQLLSHEHSRYSTEGRRRRQRTADKAFASNYRTLRILQWWTTWHYRCTIYCTWLIQMGLATAMEGWEPNMCANYVPSYIVAASNHDVSETTWKKMLKMSRWFFYPRLFLEIRGFAACGEILIWALRETGCRYLGNSSLQDNLTIATFLLKTSRRFYSEARLFGLCSSFQGTCVARNRSTSVSLPHFARVVSGRLW